MIGFKSFVDAIHNAVQSANESLMDKNDGLLRKFFVHAERDADVLRNINNAIQASNVITEKGGNVTRDEFRKASEALEKAKGSLLGLSDSSSDDLEDFGKLSPRVVTVEYPYQKEDGTVASTAVQVPLLTLTPVTMSQIEKATLKANFEMEIVDDELQLNFTSRERPPLGKRSKVTRGHLEITISPSEPAGGLLELIDGYERVLKSQIPH